VPPVDKMSVSPPHLPPAGPGWRDPLHVSREAPKDSASRGLEQREAAIELKEARE
jgi:hypothetical protein